MKTFVYARRFRLQIAEDALVLKHSLKVYVYVWITYSSHKSKAAKYLSFLNCSIANERKVQTLLTYLLHRAESFLRS